MSQLHKLSLANTLPHAWLFVGADLNVILKIAAEFSQWLLCLHKQGKHACGTCKSCNLFLAKTHPDFCSLTPHDKKTIVIDDVRLATDFTAAKPQLSSQKIVLIYPAEALHKQSANALLKSLEEPPGATIFILLTKHRELLLKTIVSRCQVLNFNTSDVPVAQANVITQQIAGDLCKLWIEKSLTTVQLVEVWIKQWPHEVLYWFEIVLTDIIRFKYTQDISLARCWCVEQATLSKVLSSSKFWAILERLRQAQYWLGQNHNPNMQLMLEDMLLG